MKYAVEIISGGIFVMIRSGIEVIPWLLYKRLHCRCY
jgi:hypothetical protein